MKECAGQGALCDEFMEHCVVSSLLEEGGKRLRPGLSIGNDFERDKSRARSGVPTWTRSNGIVHQIYEKIGS